MLSNKRVTQNGGVNFGLFSRIIAIFASITERDASGAVFGEISRSFLKKETEKA